MRKHPKQGPVSPDILVQPNLPDSNETPHPIVFESLDDKAIRNAALKVNGAVGPSGMGARAWKRLCTSFHKASDELCVSIATVARKLCTTIVSPDDFTSFTACRRLIALEKSPGICPIRRGEVARRIIGKAVLAVICMDIQKATSMLQLCSGQLAGIEAAVHAVSELFHDNASSAALLLDASNAFNNLNRKAALRNIQVFYTCYHYH